MRVRVCVCTTVDTVCMHTRANTHARAYTHTREHTHARTHRHTQTHIYKHPHAHLVSRYAHALPLTHTSAPTSPAHQVFFRRGLENVMPGDQVELKQKKFIHNKLRTRVCACAQCTRTIHVQILRCTFDRKRLSSAEPMISFPLTRIHKSVYTNPHEQGCT